MSRLIKSCTSVPRMHGLTPLDAGLFLLPVLPFLAKELDVPTYQQLDPNVVVRDNDGWRISHGNEMRPRD